MSRVGNKAIHLQQGVTVTVEENNNVIVNGPKGQSSFVFNPDIKIEVQEDTVKVSRPSDSIVHKTLHGTTRAVLNNMIEGVTNGFSRGLAIEGVGYRATLQGKKLVLAAGYSHLVELEVPEGLTVEVPTPTEINVKGIDKQAVGQFAAIIRSVRKPEPYHGKGIRYKTEVVRRKEGKKAK